MKKFILLTILILVTMAPAVLRSQDMRYSVVFYNVENLFDTINTPGVLDEEFTPRGTKAWNSYKYNKKISNLDEVFYGIASSSRSYPTIIGLAEIENRNVLEDLVAAPKLSRGNYQIAHYDSPDARGVDVALFYRPDHFRFEGSAPIPVTIEELEDFKTRDILSVWGTIEGEPFCFFVCHWPSRLGGEVASEPKRVAAATILKNAVDSIRTLRPDTKFVIMGDMNDNPNNRSLHDVLGAKGNPKNVAKDGLFNPYYEMYRAGFGTLAYNDAWNLFDNIIVSENLLNGSTGKLKLYKQKKDKYYGYIFDRSFLRQTSGQYKNYPLRTYVGDNFQGGYSDHFPVYIYIAK